MLQLGQPVVRPRAVEGPGGLPAPCGARDAAEPGKGYDAKGAEWRTKLDETQKGRNAETTN